MNNKSGSAEVVAMMYIPIYMILVLVFIVFLKANTYDYFVETVVSDMQSRMKTRCQVYRYENFNEIKEAFEEVKSEYSADFKEIYNNRTVSKNIADKIISSVSIEEMNLGDGTNLKDGFYFYRVEIQGVTVDLIWYKYKPHKVGYVIFPKEET